MHASRSGLRRHLHHRNVLSRYTGYDANITLDAIRACQMACKACADECEHHASMHEHCRICAEACRRCEKACQEDRRSMAA